MKILPDGRSPLPRWRALPGIAFATLLAALPTPGSAGDGAVRSMPRTPTADTEVIARLPTRLGAAARQERQWQARLQQSPGDLALALQLARHAISRARTEGDPRQLGLAQAALAPWWSQPDAPPAVRLLRATIRQSQHEFEPALAELDALLAAPPQHVPLALRAQAELTRAAILQVRDRLDAARTGCQRLGSPVYAALGETVSWSAAVCLAELDSLQGRPAEADAALARLARDPLARTDPQRLAWLTLVRAELADRRADPQAAPLFRSALQLQSDLYTRARYADWLLDHQRPRDVLALIPAADPTQLPDALLLRRAIALRRLQDPQTLAALDILQQRFEAAQARHDTSHRREEARWRLELRDDAAGALLLAQANWAVQREPADARLLHDCAVAAGRPEAAAPALDLLRRIGALVPPQAAVIAPRPIRS